MAYRTLITGGKAILIEKKGQKIEGFLTAAKCKVGKYKSAIYTFVTRNGPVKVWGNATIDSVLLEPSARELAHDVENKMVCITCTDTRTEKKGKVTKVYRDHTVQVDSAKTYSAKSKNVPF